MADSPTPAGAVCAADYTLVPLAGLVNGQPLTFPMYLLTANRTWVLYRSAGAALDESHIGRLHAEGVSHLFIRDEDRPAYFERIESSLHRVLLDRGTSLERRADILHGVAMRVVSDLYRGLPDRASVQRAHWVVAATGGLLLREQGAFQAIRRVLQSTEELARHSLVVGFLSMALARTVLDADAGTLLMAGMAGLLHDIGRVGHEDACDDHEHPLRGAECLAALGVAEPVRDVVASHHERGDGSGYPRGLRSEQIVDLTRVVGLSDLFDEIHCEQRGTVFESLRVLAFSHRDSFDDRLTKALITLFR